jgi:hypothetical protein
LSHSHISAVVERVKEKFFKADSKVEIGLNSSLIAHVKLAASPLSLDLLHSMKSKSDDISELRNLGPTSAAWLRDAGILSQSQLRLIGPVVAYLIVRERIPKASLNLLWSLAAGLEDRDWRELSASEKQRLLEERLRLTLKSDD